MRTSAKRIAAVWFSLCVGLVLLGASGAAHCGEQADKAVAAVKLLMARGELKPDAVLRMRVKQGNTSSFLGRDYELQKDWEKQTGILLDVSVMPQVDSLEIIRRSNDIDLTIARNHEYPDLVAGRLIEDLTPLLQRFGFALSNNIWLAASGKLTSKEAMAKTAREWEAITDARGRAQQIAHWQAFKKLYPSATESPR